jgi:membrane-associated phospholipid phosphatase
MATVALIRDGVAPHVPIARLDGIVVFPSYHTIAALVFIYAFRRSGWISGVALLLNLALLAAVPVFGNHYLADMIGGAAVAAAGIGLLRLSKAPSLVHPKSNRELS